MQSVSRAGVTRPRDSSTSVSYFTDEILRHDDDVHRGRPTNPDGRRSTVERDFVSADGPFLFDLTAPKSAVGTSQRPIIPCFQRDIDGPPVRDR
jgi:hypothetical protein